MDFLHSYFIIWKVRYATLRRRKVRHRWVNVKNLLDDSQSKLWEKCRERWTLESLVDNNNREKDRTKFASGGGGEGEGEKIIELRCNANALFVTTRKALLLIQLMNY